MKLHLFYPENDLALASGKAGYTPPPRVMDLRRAGAVLPLWYGDPGDKVCTTGVSAAWFDSMAERFDLRTDVFDHTYHSGMQPAPWGWSEASASLLRQQGVPAQALPGSERLEQIRSLSHRRTAAVVHGLVAAQLPFAIAPAAVECMAVEALPALLESGRGFMAKLPWSSSGRGLLDSRKCSAAHFIRQASGMIHSQGSFMLEQAYDRVLDFAMLFDCEDSGCFFRGYSLFSTTASGQYSGNQLLPDAEIEHRLARYIPVAQLNRVSVALEAALRQVCGDVYRGPIGVDMLVADTPRGYLLDATVEINFRMTMGRVARVLSDRFVAPGLEATFYVRPGAAPADTAGVENHRFAGGVLPLSPPGSRFAFVIHS